MRKGLLQSIVPITVLWGCVALLASSCNPSKHVESGQYLLRSNSLKLKSDRTLTNRGELSDALTALIIQKPNTYFLGFIPYKVALYNARYKRFQRDTSAEAFQRKIKTVERPVIYDSLLADRSAQHIRSYLFNQGYFYSKVRDTAILNNRKKQAKTVYEVKTGQRYLINKTTLDIDDSTVKAFLEASMGESAFASGKPYTMTLADEERSRIVNLLRNRGYYKFTNENIHVDIDTINKAYLRNAENPFESAINFIALQRSGKQPTVDIRIIIRRGDEPMSYRRYKIGKVKVYPDFVDRRDINDKTMYEHIVDDVVFRYHRYYVREKVLMSHIFMQPGEYFTQENYDLTITKLNDLGLFQYVQTYIIEDSTLPEDRPLRCIILMTPTKRYDLSLSYEVSNGTTYTLGNNFGINFRNRNMLKGANQLSISLTGGIELGYDRTSGKNLIDHLYLLSRNAGINATLDFPKFIAPFSLRRINRTNEPRTIFSLGTGILDRVNYFTLINTSASLSYNFRQNTTNTWDFSPVFVNVLRLPSVADSFQKRLAANDFLRNSYKENFVEGENLYFTFTNRDAPSARRHYSYLRAGAEEAGALLSTINSGFNLENSLGLKFSQYLKIETDLRHYIRRPHAELATRFFAGIGLPYDKSAALPYIKQYFVGGPYSLRGWRVRQLGPGSYFDTVTRTSTNTVDRTGDIKLEANAELRFDVVQLFGGALHLAGAAFVDAGNIWLSHSSGDYPGGAFRLANLGKDLAVSSGLGARFDISGLFVLRTDAGFPVKYPAYAMRGGWVVNEVNPLKKDWRSQNLVLHIAIGYPF